VSVRNSQPPNPVGEPFAARGGSFAG